MKTPAGPSAPLVYPSASEAPGRRAVSGTRMAWGPVALFCLLWSSAFAGAKFGLRDCPPLTLLTIRFFLAAAALLALAAWHGNLRLPGWRELGVLVLLGILNNALYLGLSWTGMLTVSSAFTAVLISTNPLLIGVLAGPVLGERLTGRKLAGLLLGLAGVALVLRSRLGGMHEDPHGVWLVAGGLVALVAATLLYKRCPPASGLWLSTGIQALAGALTLLPCALLRESGEPITWSLNLFCSLAYMVLAVSVGGYALWFHILRRSTATAASALHFLMPPLGLLFGWLTLGEHVAAMDLLGILPIAAGIWLATREPVNTRVSR